MPLAPPPDGITIGRGEGIVWNKLHAVLATAALAIPALANTRWTPARNLRKFTFSCFARSTNYRPALFTPSADGNSRATKITSLSDVSGSAYFCFRNFSCRFLQRWWGLIDPLWKLFPLGNEIMAECLSLPLFLTFSIGTHVLKSYWTDNRLTICGSWVYDGFWHVESIICDYV